MGYLTDGRKRIIPAYAGSTSRETVARMAAMDHPRVCGEHKRPQNADRHLRGSSPRMRGAHSAAGLVGGFAGIIPAYAGSTNPSP